MHIDIMVATLDPLRTLDDIMNPDTYSELKQEHNKNIRDPKLTWDEMNLRALYENVDKEVGRMKRLISDHAVDKKWLQDLVPKNDVNLGSDESKYVVYCDSSKATDFFDAKMKERNGSEKTITIPKGKTGSLDELLVNLNLPQDGKGAVNMVDPMTKTLGTLVNNRSELVDAMLHTNSLGLLIKGPFDFDKEVDRYVARAHIRWRQLAAYVPGFTSFRLFICTTSRPSPSHCLPMCQMSCWTVRVSICAQWPAHSI